MEWGLCVLRKRDRLPAFAARLPVMQYRGSRGQCPTGLPGAASLSG